MKTARIYPPLAADHPVTGKLVCAVCNKTFAEGDETVIDTGHDDQEEGAKNRVGRLAHATCARVFVWHFVGARVEHANTLAEFAREYDGDIPELVDAVRKLDVGARINFEIFEPALSIERKR